MTPRVDSGGKTVADHAELASPLKVQALVWLATGETGRALAALERVLRIGELAQPRTY